MNASGTVYFAYVELIELSIRITSYSSSVLVVVHTVNIVALLVRESSKRTKVVFADYRLRRV